MNALDKGVPTLDEIYHVIHLYSYVQKKTRPQREVY